MADFDSKQKTFWGVITASLWFGSSFLKYMADRKAKQQIKKEEMRMEGIKETKEVLVAAHKVAGLLIKKFKDGVQVQDGLDIGASLLMDGEVKSALSSALDGISKVPAELKDLDYKEIMELAKDEIDMVSKEIIENLKK